MHAKVMSLIPTIFHRRRLALGCSFLLPFAGCLRTTPPPASPPPHLIQSVDLTWPNRPLRSDAPITLLAARNEWTDFVVRLNCRGGALRVSPFAVSGASSADQTIRLSAYQILPVPVDFNRADYVRRQGAAPVARSEPRVLLPLPVHGDLIDLSSLRDPARPTEPSAANLAGSVLLWIDLHVNDHAPAGQYESHCDALDAAGNSIGSLPIRLAVADFSLPSEPSLRMIGQVDWTALSRLYPSFEPIAPRLLSRNDDRNAAAVRTLDQLIALAHANRTQIAVPRLQPTVKWPPGALPQIDWSDFDSLVGGWLSGAAFDDRIAIGYWPLPTPDYLDNYDPQSKADYWRLAALHFAQLGWLPRCPVALHLDSPGSPTMADELILSAAARLILAVHPEICVQLPLESEQVQWASAANQNLVDASQAARLLTEADDAVSLPSAASPTRQLLMGVRGNQFDVRSRAMLAFLRNVKLVIWNDTLPEAVSIDQPSAAGETAWFYPGEWFALDRPLETIQLKWARRAQEDYEYLQLARQHGDGETAAQIARLLVRPVELRSGQQPDPVYDLFCGVSNPLAYGNARQLLADRIVHKSTPGDAIDLRTLRWAAEQQKPNLLPRSVQWKWDDDPEATAGRTLAARITMDVYTPWETAQSTSQFQWSLPQHGWQIRPQAMNVSTEHYGVQQATTDGKFNLDRAGDEASTEPMAMTFIGPMPGQSVVCRFVLPVAVSQRRQRQLSIDGSLDEWNAVDALQLDRPLVAMLNRPDVQAQQLKMADQPASIYSAWSDDNFYLAFRLGGVDSIDIRSTHNFVNYQDRRAWGEDLAEILIQPIYIDNSTGPLLHIVCKPGGDWVERKDRPSDDEFTALEGAGVRYASSVDPRQQIWRGELAIPWRAIADSGRGRPSLLRFNFIQHQNSTGQSASWAGPIDFGRDDRWMGLIHLHEEPAPGLAAP